MIALNVIYAFNYQITEHKNISYILLNILQMILNYIINIFSCSIILLEILLTRFKLK
jgi:hypothetical protein